MGESVFNPEGFIKGAKLYTVIYKNITGFQIVEYKIHEHVEESSNTVKVKEKITGKIVDVYKSMIKTNYYFSKIVMLSEFEEKLSILLEEIKLQKELHKKRFHGRNNEEESVLQG